MASVPASVDVPNEDFVGAVPTAAVLIDGAGVSNRLGAELLGRLSLDATRDLTTLLGEAIELVADSHRATCDLADPSSPAGTVAILRLGGGRADHLVLGDSVLVLDHVGGAPVVVEDRREVELSRPYRAALEATDEGSADHERIRGDFIDMLRGNRNQPGGFWVAKDDPRAASEAVTGSARTWPKHCPSGWRCRG